jgi:hypothetical protein
MVERRDGFRASRVVAVKHRIVDHDSRKTGSQWSLSTTRNMSVSGLLFNSAVAYEPGDLIELEIVMSGVIDIYRGYARVVRVNEVSAHSLEVAVKYFDMKMKPRPAKSHLVRPRCP